MGIVDVLRRGHALLIDENPIDVAIFREERVREGGGFRDVKEYVGLVHGRLYQESTGRAGGEESTTIPGTLHTEARWGFVCMPTMLPVDDETGELVEDGEPIDTDIRAGAHVTDSFEHPRFGRYKITSVYPREDLGTVWGWAASVEVYR